MPRPDQVDDEEWLTLMAGDAAEGGTTDLDALLSRFQNFMVQPADVEGVDVATTAETSNEEIRPRVVLNLLHAVLKGEPLSFPTLEEVRASLGANQAVAAE